MRRIWSWRRWAYGAWLIVAVTRIPARTGFRLVPPACDTRLTLENLGLSMTKVPHMVLFGAFFLITIAMFDRLSRKAFAWSFAATAAIGLLVELQEGATRTGNCRLTDVAPDLVGAAAAAALVGAAIAVWNRIVRPSKGDAPEDSKRNRRAAARP